MFSPSRRLACIEKKCVSVLSGTIVPSKDLSKDWKVLCFLGSMRSTPSRVVVRDTIHVCKTDNHILPICVMEKGYIAYVIKCCKVFLDFV